MILNLQSLLGWFPLKHLKQMCLLFTNLYLSVSGKALNLVHKWRGWSPLHIIQFSDVPLWWDETCFLSPPLPPALDLDSWRWSSFTPPAKSPLMCCTMNSESSLNVGISVPLNVNAHCLLDSWSNFSTVMYTNISSQWSTGLLCTANDLKHSLVVSNNFCKSWGDSFTILGWVKSLFKIAWTVSLWLSYRSFSKFHATS